MERQITHIFLCENLMDVNNTLNTLPTSKAKDNYHRAWIDFYQALPETKEGFIPLIVTWHQVKKDDKE